jgi:hypothetical protein
MRYLVYDEDDVLLRKFWDKESAQRFMQDGWKLITQPKPQKKVPSIEEYGEARW